MLAFTYISNREYLIFDHKESPEETRKALKDLNISFKEVILYSTSKEINTRFIINNRDYKKVKHLITTERMFNILLGSENKNGGREITISNTEVPIAGTSRELTAKTHGEVEAPYFFDPATKTYYSID